MLPTRRDLSRARIVVGLFLAIAVLTVTSSLSAQPGSDTQAPAAPVQIAPREEPAAAPSNRNAAQPPEKPQTVIPTTPAEVVVALNWWGLPFAIATVICIWFTTERLVVLRRARVIPRPFVERFLHHLREGSLTPEEALKRCEENGSPIAKVFAHGVRKWGKPSVEIEQAIIDGGERQVSELRKHLRVLNGISNICPLIGLLGTVWGMIVSFNGIATTAAMGSTEKLAAGIALALLTTVAGLVIAIPAMVTYLYLSGRVDDRVMEMDQLAQEVVYLISAEALQEAPKSSRAKS